jgi:hypothetical protein
VLVGVAIVFVAYSAYFHKLGYGWTHLFDGYRPHTIAGLSAGLTANMLNIWFPFAVHGASATVPIYATVRGLPKLVRGRLLAYPRSNRVYPKSSKD